MKESYDTRIKVAKIWQDKEHTNYRLHHHITLLAGVLKKIPEELWKFDKVVIEREGKPTITLTNALKVVAKKMAYFTIPASLSKKHQLGKEDVHVTLQW